MLKKKFNHNRFSKLDKLAKYFKTDINTLQDQIVDNLYNEVFRAFDTDYDLNEVLVIPSVLDTFSKLCAYLDLATVRKQKYIVFENKAIQDKIATDVSRMKLYPASLDAYLMYKYNLTIKYT